MTIKPNYDNDCVSKDMLSFLDEDLLTVEKRGAKTLEVSIDTEYKSQEMFTTQLSIQEWGQNVMIFNSKLKTRYPDKAAIIDKL